MTLLQNKKRQCFWLAASAAVLTACATLEPQGEFTQFSLGENASGDPCVATQNWTDPSYGESSVKFADAYSVTCRGTTTGALGRVRVFKNSAELAAFSGNLQCGIESDISLEGFGTAKARRCNDPGLGFAAIVVDAERNGRSYQMSSAPNAIGAAYQATRILAGYKDGGNLSSTRTPFKASAIARSEVSDTAEVVSGGLETIDTILSRGTTLNFRGLHSDASRYLNNAINSLSSNVPERSRAELILEAGLANSNIKFFASADRNFSQAAQIIDSLESAEQLALRAKLRNYQGLHALNKRDFTEARNLLSNLVADQDENISPVSDATTFVKLNRTDPDEVDVRSSISLPDEAILRDAFLYTQAAWALSVSEIALGNNAGAETALDNAEDRFELLKETLLSARIRNDGIFWMSAQLSRQRGRLEASKGNYTRALSLFDDAVNSLTRGAIAKSGTGTEPAIAELKLERAALTSRARRSDAEIDTAYQDAIAALIAARDENFTFRTTVLAPYLDRLVEQIEAGDVTAQEKLFMALQVTGETGAARQISQLQNIVTADSGTGGLLRDIQELQRELSRLDLEIGEARAKSANISSLEKQRDIVQQRFFELDSEVASDARFNAISSRPATVADLQYAMLDGEAYVKFNQIGDRVFGILIQKNAVHPISPEQSVSDILLFKDRLRGSIDGDIAVGKLPEFSVASAVVLYRMLFGGVEDIINDPNNPIRELIVDGGEVLNGVSAAVLVTDPQAARKFARQANKFDYSNIDFLAKKMSTSVAISPRSFIASRDLAPSSADMPLLGFAAPEPLTRVSMSQDMVKVGPCLLTSAEIGGLSRRFVPIPADEINIAARALGLGAPSRLISQTEFTDSEILRLGQAGGDLANYKVVHFATHGLTEGQFGCEEAPAALLTSFGQNGSDMLLSFDEIAKLRLDANLVVLSACETASEIGERALRLSGEALPGASLEGLVRAFFSANARSVMATYWESSNSGESEMFMKSFYENGKTQPIASALNIAQNDLMTQRDTSHPFYWGGFFVVGNTANMMLSSGTSVVAALDEQR